MKKKAFLELFLGVLVGIFIENLKAMDKQVKPNDSLPKQAIAASSFQQDTKASNESFQSFHSRPWPFLSRPIEQGFCNRSCSTTLKGTGFHVINGIHKSLGVIEQAVHELCLNKKKVKRSESFLKEKVTLIENEQKTLFDSFEKIIKKIEKVEATEEMLESVNNIKNLFKLILVEKLPKIFSLISNSIDKNIQSFAQESTKKSKSYYRDIEFSVHSFCSFKPSSNMSNPVFKEIIHTKEALQRINEGLKGKIGYKKFQEELSLLFDQLFDLFNPKNQHYKPESIALIAKGLERRILQVLMEVHLESVRICPGTQ